MNPIQKAKSFIASKGGFTQVLIAIVVVIVADVLNLASTQRSHYDHGCGSCPVTLWNRHQQHLRSFRRSELHNHWDPNPGLWRTQPSVYSGLCTRISKLITLKG